MQRNELLDFLDRPADALFENTGSPFLDELLTAREREDAERRVDRLRQSSESPKSDDIDTADIFARASILYLCADVFPHELTSDPLFVRKRQRCGSVVGAFRYRTIPQLSPSAAGAIFTAIADTLTKGSRYIISIDLPSFEELLNSVEAEANISHPHFRDGLSRFLDVVNTEQGIACFANASRIESVARAWRLLGRPEETSAYLSAARSSRHQAEELECEAMAISGPLLGPLVSQLLNSRSYGSHANRPDRKELDRLEKALFEARPEDRGDVLIRIYRVVDLFKDVAIFRLGSGFDPNMFRYFHSACEYLRKFVLELVKRKIKLAPEQALELIEYETGSVHLFGSSNGPRRIGPFKAVAASLSPDLPGANKAVDALVGSWRNPESVARRVATMLKSSLESKDRSGRSTKVRSDSTKIQNRRERVDRAYEALSQLINGYRQLDRRLANPSFTPLGRLIHNLNDFLDARRERRTYSEEDLFRLRRAPDAAELVNESLVAHLDAVRHGSSLENHRSKPFCLAALHENTPESYKLGARSQPQAIQLIAFYETLSARQREVFGRSERFAAERPTTSKPTAKWRKSASKVLTAEDISVIVPIFCRYLELREPSWNRGYRSSALDDAVQVPLLGLICMAADWPADPIAPTLHDFATRCFTGRFIKAEQLGNACIWSLSQLADRAGAVHLARLASKVRYPKVRKRIEAALDAVAKEAGITRSELEELIVPTHGLGSDSDRSLPLRNGQVTLAVQCPGTSASLTWTSEKGRTVRSPTPAMRMADPEGIKSAKDLAKEIDGDLAAQRRRIEQFYLSNRGLDPNVWQERYIDHPLLGPMCRSLIWRIDRDGTAVAGLWRTEAGRLEDLSGHPIALDAARVSLWHPIEASAADVASWRDRLEALGVVQPFRQAWREVYAVTDAERATGSYSNRFAGHVLRQHQMMNLARLNGWACRHRIWADTDNSYPTHIALPAFGLYAEYWTEGAGGEDPPVLDSQAYIYVNTDRVAFYRLARSDSSSPETMRGEPIPVDEVPSIAFTEVMRHCDLFVAVASIALDPEWRDRGADAAHPDSWYRDTRAYWEAGAMRDLAESARVRRAMLERIIPMLKIADRLELEQRHLRVQGRKRAYRVHLGSAAVLREPDDRHVCIVPKGPSLKRGEKLSLPFQGDSTLSVIVAKAMLLANDAAITDEVIRSQID